MTNEYKTIVRKVDEMMNILTRLRTDFTETEDDGLWPICNCCREEIGQQIIDVSHDLADLI